MTEISTTPGGAPVKAPRDHLYITPRKRRLSEYEAVTCYTQPGPDAFDIEGWFTLGPGPEHRTAWRKESTRLVHPHWWDFRDPAQQWQRTYVRMQAEQERSIERATADAASSGAFADMDPAWLTDVVAGHYRIWSFFEYALFRAFAVASREALSDTLGNVLCFQGFDHMRHAQAAVLYLMVLEESVEGFLDQGAKQRWIEDPIYQPMRALAERLMLSTDDWGELAVAVNLVVAPILSEMAMSQLVRRGGPHRGDSVTPFIVSTTERDRRRNLGYTEELVRMVTAEGIEGHQANRDVIAGWIADWTPPVLEAARALRPVFDQARVDVVSFDGAMAAALHAQRTLVEALGLSPAAVAGGIGGVPQK
jgi:methane monooxygenase component A beta chain/propane monooxygenase small subunit